MKKSRKLLIYIFAFIVILVLVYYYRPIKISKVMQNNGNSMLQIIHMRGSEDVNNPDITSENYKIDSNSNEINSIYTILSNYYYHSSIDTLIKNTLVHDSDDMLAIKNDKHTIMITDNYKIMIDGIPYKIGYISNKKSKNLISEILSILKTD
jgi:hypothetical protein